MAMRDLPDNKGFQDHQGGIPDNLLQDLKRTLENCTEFETANNLKAFFGNSQRLAVYKNMLPDTNNVQDRVSETISKFIGVQVRGERVLVVMLDDLAQQYPSADSRQVNLETLRDQLMPPLATPPAQGPVSQSTPPASLSPPAIKPSIDKRPTVRSLSRLILLGLLGLTTLGLGGWGMIALWNSKGEPVATPTVTILPTGTASPTDAPAATTPSILIPIPPDLPMATPDLPDPISIISATPPGCDPGVRQNLEQTLESKLGSDTVTAIPNVGRNEPPATNVQPGTALIYIWWDCAESTIGGVSITFLAPPAYPIWLLHEVETLSMPATLGDPQQLALGASQYALGNYDGARTALLPLADANQQSQGAGQIHWLVGNTLLHLEQWGDAYDYYSYGIPLLSGGADGEQIKLFANQALGALMAKQSGKNPEQMGCSTAQRQSIPEAEKIDPANITIKVIARMLLLECATNLDPDDAEKPIQELASASGITENDLPSVYLVQAYFQLLLGESPEGKQLACSALNLNPKLAFGYYVLGELYSGKKLTDLAKAQEAFGLYYMTATMGWQREQAAAQLTKSPTTVPDPRASLNRLCQ
jgi:tetratricopeptide (TPR) repeat protein